MDEHGMAFHLDGASLNAQAVVSIKRNIPKMSVSDGTGASGAFIYVNTMCVPAGAGVSCAMTVSFNRSVMVVTDNLKPIGYMMARVWHTGSILSGDSGSMAGRLRDELDRFLTKFAADYYQANP
jgi:hypothetical protein